MLELPNGELLMTVNPSAGGGNVPGAVQGGGDVWLLRLSQSGAVLQQRLIGGPGVDNALDLVRSGGDVFLIGSTNANGGDVTGHQGESDVWLVKLDTDLNILWQRCYGGSGNDGARAAALSDGGLFLCGSSNSSDGDLTENRGGYDAWTMRIDASGNILWSTTYGGANDDGFSSGLLDSEGLLLCSGSSSSSDGDLNGNLGSADVWITRIDPFSGELLEQGRFGGSGFETAWRMTTLTNGKYLVSGVTASTDGDLTGYNGGAADAALFCLDGDLTLEWATCYGGSQYDEFYWTIPGQNGTAICAGMTMSNNGDVSGNNGNSDYWLAGIGADGQLLWQQCYGGLGNDRCYGLFPLQDQGLLAVGTTNSTNGDVSGFNGGFSDAWVVRLSEETVGMAEERAQPTLVRYPNPCTDLLQVVNPSPTGASLPWRITDAQGRTVRTGMLGGSLGQVPVAALANGAYTIGLEWNGQWVTAPFVKE
jgi:hypothetical protein